jgi:C1A family cysteine protease
MKAVLLLAAVACVLAKTNVMSLVQAQRGNDPQWPHFAQFVKDFGRNYHTVAEVNAKFDVFKLNMANAARLSKKNPKATFGVNKFADVHPEEFARTHLMPREAVAAMNASRKGIPSWWSTHKRHAVKINPHTRVAADVNWCDQGKCTPVKDQGQCGSCWAFSATETIESSMMIAGTFQGNALGPQEIVDCDSQMQGCNGGDPRQAIDWVAQNGGLDTEAAYPYTAQDGQCAFDPSQAQGKTSGSQDVSDGDENSLQSFLQSTGPPSVCVDASSWQSYTGGVLTDCGQQIDHAVQAVGIDSSNNAYIVRNSWGEGWGESGMIRVQMGQNLCMIANEVTWAS